LLTDAESKNLDTRLRARNALGLEYMLTGAISEQIALDRKTAKEFPLDRRSRQRLVYGLLRVDAAEEAQAMVEELIAIDSADRWTRDLAKLVKDYRNLGTPAVAQFAGEALQVHRNHLLWRKLPASVAETWAVEHVMPTETLTLSPAKR
jgi:hypothetical protein